MTREEIAERMRSDALRVAADYHRERERYGGASRDLHAFSLTAIEDVRSLADAVRALPVIATCGECGWARDGERSYDGPHVLCSKVTGNSLGWRVAVPHDAAPPSWCPMRGER